MSFQQRLKEARLKAGLTQKQLAEKVNVTNSAIANYETGVSSAKVEVMLKIIEVLQTSPNFLFQDDFENLIDIDMPTVDNLSKHEQTHIKKYRSLNNEGQDKINDYIDDLSMNPRYLKISKSTAYTEKEKPVDIKTPSRPLIAARSGGVKEITDEQLADFELFLKHKQKGK